MNRSGQERRAASMAFTLIELLVVIAIIVIIASMLLPVVMRAKESGRTAICSSNSRQLAIATSLYAEDNRGRMPAFTKWLWTKPGDIKTGRLYPYLKTKQVYLCPTDRNEMSRRNKAKVPAPSGFGAGFGGNRMRDYSLAMNCALCHHNDLAKFASPSKTVVYLEAQLATNDYSGQAGPNGSNKLLTERHSGRKGHLIMGDMSVQRMNKKQFDRAARDRFFWYPSGQADSGMNGGLE